MMEHIIYYSCAKKEIEKLLELNQLRFEQLIEIIQHNLDKNLKIIDYYGQCDKPNIQHLFLAEMIINGHFVMTTNFDFLIEYALLQMGIPKEKIIPIITTKDFQKYSNPYRLKKQGKKPLYKIHGSTQNIITHTPTRESLITTIKALGANKEGLNIFQLEPYKLPLFRQITERRTLIIMGYSGGDDFDVIPSLKVLKNVKNIIWINHKKNVSTERVYKINLSNQQDKINLSNQQDKIKKIDQILIDIYRMGNVEQVYLVDVNTTFLIKNLMCSKREEKIENFNLPVKEWLIKNLKSPNIFIKKDIPLRIYLNFDKNDEAFRCAKEIRDLADKKGNSLWKCRALYRIGEYYHIKGEYDESVDWYIKSLENYERLKPMGEKNLIYYDLAMIYQIRGDFKEAVKIYNKLLKSQNNNLSLGIYVNLAQIYKIRGKYEKALFSFNLALQRYDEYGNMYDKAAIFNGRGDVFQHQSKYIDALKNYNIALNIHDKLGSSLVKTGLLNNIGTLYFEIGNLEMALNYHYKAIEIAEKLNDITIKVSNLNNIGIVYKSKGLYYKALNCFEEVLEISKRLGNIKENIIALNNIGQIYQFRGDLSKANQIYTNALRLNEKIKNPAEKASLLNGIASILCEQNQYSDALEKFEEALKIVRTIGKKSEVALFLSNIGYVYYKIGDKTKAINKFKESYQLYQKIGLANTQIAKVLKTQIEKFQDEL